MPDKTSIDKRYFDFVLILKTDLFLSVWDFYNENLYKVIMLWIYLKQMEKEHLYVGQNVQNITILWNLPQIFTIHCVFILPYLHILKDISKNSFCWAFTVWFIELIVYYRKMLVLTSTIWGACSLNKGNFLMTYLAWHSIVISFITIKITHYYQKVFYFILLLKRGQKNL